MSKEKIERIFSALGLITLGIVFLLNSTNIIPWGMWQYVFLIFISIWPIFLIIAGIRIIFANNIFSKILGELIQYFIFVTVVALSMYASLTPNFAEYIKSRNFLRTAFSDNNSQNKNLTLPQDKYQNINSRELNFDITTGEFQILDGQDQYMSIDAKYSDNYGEPILTDREINQRLIVDFNQKRSSGILWTPFDNSPNYQFNIGQKNLETDINLKMTAGDGKIRLDNLRLNKIDTKLTAGDLQLFFTDDSLPKEINISQTAGDIEIYLPKGIQVDIEYKKTAGDLKIFDNKIESNNGTYLTDKKDKSIKIYLEITAGDLTIKN